MKFPTHWRPALAAAALLAAASAQATGITYLATDLADSTPGEDLWAIEYTVSGPLGLFESLDVQFGAALYSQLAVLGSSNPAALDAEPPVQPDAANGLDGYVSFRSQADHGAGTIGTVSMSFIWLGGGVPGAQAFNHADAGFNVIGSGQTVAGVVPEPAAVWLMLAGIAAVGAQAARRRQSR